MTNVHHATAKKAEAHGLEFRNSQGEGWTIHAIGEDAVIYSGTDPKSILDRVITDGLAPKTPEKGNGTKKPIMSKEERMAHAEATRRVEDDDEEDEEELPSGSIVKNHYKEEYAARGDATCCGDDLSQILKDALTMVEEPKGGLGKKSKLMLDHAALRELAEQHGWAQKVDKTWAHLNPGQKRMNLGNMLRKKMREEGFVMVFKTKVVDPDWEDEGDDE